MIAKRLIVSLSSLAFVAGVTALGVVSAASAPGLSCVEGQAASLSALGSPGSEGIVAALRENLVAVDEEGSRTVALADTSGRALLRHVASEENRIAYVLDQLGPDLLMTVGPEGTSERLPGGEVTHPAWSATGELAYAVDLERIEIASPDGSFRSVGRPPGTVGVFSPVFSSSGELLAVAQEAVPGAQTHDDALNNLFRLTTSGTWMRLTSFTADADRWSLIRTPLVDGTRVLFVRETGRASGTAAEGPSAFELWETGPQGAKLVRSLSSEAYLAAVGDTGLVWNVERESEWRLLLEGPQGYRDLGCGAVMVDPRNESDPDRAEEVPSVPALEEVEAPGIVLGEGMSIVVGDFASRAEAEGVADALRLPSQRVLDHANAPFAVAPGAFVVAVPLTEMADAADELDAFRARFPSFAERSWISWTGALSSAV